MDVLHQLPPRQEGQTIAAGEFAGFAVSLQGASHASKEPAIPCQDYSSMRCLEAEGILLAAIADGVGSCSQSHWGAYTAVCAALDCAEQALKRLSGGKALNLADCENGQMKAILLQAFQNAQDAVEQLADGTQQLPYSFQSTLTLAIYDGQNLFYGHIGDDGIVVQTQDGIVEMLTARMKGDEASSVYPLQSGERMWHFGKSTRPVAAFVMATDGVLDAFVANRVDYYGVNYCKGVCYAFMEEAVYTLAKGEKDAPKTALDRYIGYLTSPEYRAGVTDDLTLVAVVSRKQIAGAKHPKFSMAIWDTIQRESNAARRQLLRHRELPCADLGNVIPVEQQKPMPRTAKPGQSTQSGSPEKKKQPEQVSDSTQKKPGHIWLTILLTFFLIAAALAAGIAAGRFLLPEIAPEEYEMVTRQCNDLTQTVEELTLENGGLEEAVRQLEETLAQGGAQLSAAENQIAVLQQEIAELQLELQAAAAEPEAPEPIE